MRMLVLLCLFIFLFDAGGLWARERLVVSGMVRPAGRSQPITHGSIEIRWPGHEDTFVPVEVPIREDGSYRISVDILPERDDVLPDLTITATAPGYLLTELPLFRDGTRATPDELTVDIELRASTLDGILNIFSCCVLSMGILTVMLPAFFLGAAITVFIPSQQILKWLGPSAPQPLAYGAAVSSGMILSLCSCNVIPLFLSIWRSGAGLGPAFAFLYAGPAINVLGCVFTCRVIGLGIGLFRILAVAAISVAVGLIMSRVFRSRGTQVPQPGPGMIAVGPGLPVTALLLGLLLYLLIIGSFELKMGWRLGLTLPALAAIVGIAVFRLGRDYTRLWLRETAGLLLKVIPILVPAVFVIGFLAQRIPLHSVRWLTGSNTLACNALASVIGAFMYFPILTETAFVKTMLKVMGMGIGPGLALLLTAPGLSLPGMLIVSRDIGFRKLAVYVASITVMAMFTGWLFGSEWGSYICTCLLD